MDLLSTSNRKSTKGISVWSGVPGSQSEGRTRMPSCESVSPNSCSEHNIPWLSTPRIVALCTFKSPNWVPGTAKAVVIPFFTFGAPQTTVRRVPLPSLTSQTVSLSASGCAATSSTRATRIPSRPSPTLSSPSTSATASVKRFASSAKSTPDRSTYRPSHAREYFTGSSYPFVY